MDHREVPERVLRRRFGRAAAAAVAALGASALWWLAFTKPAFAVTPGVNVVANVTPTSSLTLLIQEHFQWFENEDALTPSSSLGAENATATVPSPGTNARLRMNIANVGGITLAAGATFALQYANTTSGPWTDVGTGAAWDFKTNPSVPDGSILATLLLASSTVPESYGASNPSAATPNQVASTTYAEWDWSLANVSATTSANWFFRMVNASGTLLSGYVLFPEFAATTTIPNNGGGGGGGGGPVFGVPSSYPSSPLPGPVSAPTTTPASTTTSTTPVLPPHAAPPYSCPLDTAAGRTAGFQRVDLNCDGNVDIIDFSILLYFYDQSGPQVSRYDFDGNGTVDFADISILMYYWSEPFVAGNSTTPYAS